MLCYARFANRIYTNKEFTAMNTIYHTLVGNASIILYFLQNIAEKIFMES